MKQLNGKVASGFLFLCSLAANAHADGTVLIPLPDTFVADLTATILVFAAGILSVLVVRYTWRTVKSMMAGR